MSSALLPRNQAALPHQHPAWVKAVWGLSAVYVVAVMALTMWPNLSHTAVPRWAHATLNWLNAHGITMAFGTLERLANFMMFFPFGVLAGILVTHHKFHWHIAHRWAAASAAGILFSAFIETVQRVIPGRVSDPGDVLMNGSGALVGAGLVALIMHLLHGRSAQA